MALHHYRSVIGSGAAQISKGGEEKMKNSNVSIRTWWRETYDDDNPWNLPPYATRGRIPLIVIDEYEHHSKMTPRNRALLRMKKRYKWWLSTQTEEPKNVPNGHKMNGEKV